MAAKRKRARYRRAKPPQTRSPSSLPKPHKPAKKAAQPPRKPRLPAQPKRAGKTGRPAAAAQKKQALHEEKPKTGVAPAPALFHRLLAALPGRRIPHDTQKKVAASLYKKVAGHLPSLNLLRKNKPARTYPTILLQEPQKIISIPAFGDLKQVNITYPLIEPFAYAHISWEPKEKKLVYAVVEPELTEKEQALLRDLEENMMEVIDVKMSSIQKTDKLIDYLKKKVVSLLDEMGVSPTSESYTKIMYYLFRNFVGLNEIEPLVHDPYIEDIGCTGLDTPIYVIHRRFGSIETAITYADPAYLTSFVIKMSERCGRYISYATPLLDGSLPDGSRVQASLAKDVTTKGPTFTIRKFRRNPYSPADLIVLKSASPSMIAYLWFLVEFTTSILVCGGVSTGKTTMLNVLSMFIPPEQKIISIEDTRELNLTHKNWIPAVARTGFGIPEAGGKRYGEVTLFDLLKESFRQNPDYVIVGEIRGKEAYVMFQGMSSGHPSLGTMHAGSIEDVMKRLETPPIELSPSLIESLDIILVMINAREKGEDARRVKEIVEVQSVDVHTGIAHYKKIFSWIPSTDTFKENIEESELIRRIAFREGFSYAHIMQDLEDRRRFIEWLLRSGMVDYDQFSRMVNMFYKDRKSAMDLVNRHAGQKSR